MKQTRCERQNREEPRSKEIALKEPERREKHCAREDAPRSRRRRLINETWSWSDFGVYIANLVFTTTLSTEAVVEASCELRCAYILHKFFADGANFFGESGGEHHHLLFVRSEAEDVLHVPTHVCEKANRVECKPFNGIRRQRGGMIICSPVRVVIESGQRAIYRISSNYFPLAVDQTFYTLHAAILGYL